ncbi:MAG: DUF4389 domain-containing protein [Chloroflexi bacterium]|nr:DUF4389 domain-containing protein [Chloroflexota bacterium]
MNQTMISYPAVLSIDYPHRDLNKLTTFFRLFVILPIGIVLGLITAGTIRWETEDRVIFQFATGGLVVLPTLLMLLFRQKYPRWWFDWNVALYKFSTRVSSYFLLLRDEYPSTDSEQAVHIQIAYPDAEKDLNRWLPLVKWLLAIPHYFVLVFLVIGAIVSAIIAWFAILFTGRYPKGLFDFVVGVLRWSLRLEAYAFLLVTDRYPPFSLN